MHIYLLNLDEKGIPKGIISMPGSLLLITKRSAEFIYPVILTYKNRIGGKR